MPPKAEPLSNGTRDTNSALRRSRIWCCSRATPDRGLVKVGRNGRRIPRGARRRTGRTCGAAMNPSMGTNRRRPWRQLPRRSARSGAKPLAPACPRSRRRLAEDVGDRTSPIKRQERFRVPEQAVSGSAAPSLRAVGDVRAGPITAEGAASPSPISTASFRTN